MKLDLSNLKIPQELPDKEWDVLKELVHQNPIPGIVFCDCIDKLQWHWDLEEQLGELRFKMLRNKYTKQRCTVEDMCGCIGFSSLNLNDKRLYLTEGVSDFITVKLTHPGYNVLGFTTLGGSYKARAIVVSLFDNIVIVADNDSTKVVNTGLRNADKLYKFLSSYGKKVKIVLPEPPHKDITDQFIFDLKVWKTLK